MNNRPEHTNLGEGMGGDELGTDAFEPTLEPGLRAALRHQDPPPGFADRLVARALAGDQPTATAPSSKPQDHGKLLPWRVRPLWMKGAIAAALILGLFEGEGAYKSFREQQRRIAQATAQFQTTERVTVHALAQAREQLQRAGVPLTLD